MVPKDEPLTAGGTIEGLVGVTVDKTCRCRKLTIALEWHTHGRGNKARGQATTEILFEGEWTAGERHAYPFSLTVPNGPFTYHGSLLNVDWRLVANADIPWAFDPRAIRDVRLDPPATHGPLDMPITYTPPEKVGRVVGTVVTVFMASVFGVMAVCMGVISCGIVADSGNPLFSVVFLAIPILFGVGCVFAIYRAVRPWIARSRLGEVTVEAPDAVLPGGEIPVTVCVTPRRNQPVDEIAVVVQGNEIVVSGSGTNKRTHRNTVFNQRVRLVAKETLGGGKTHRFDAVVQLHSDAPLSFRATSNRLEYTITAHVDVPGFLDVDESRRLEVQPPRQ